MSKLSIIYDGDRIIDEDYPDDMNALVQVRMSGPTETVGLVRDGDDMLLSFSLAPGGVSQAQIEINSLGQSEGLPPEPVRTGEDAEQPEASVPGNLAQEAADEES